MSEYRVSWEMPPPISSVADYEGRFGKGVWPTLSIKEWEALPWRPCENITDDHDGAHDQFTQLRAWADTHEQPIRNVRIEQRDPNAWVAL